MCCSGFYSPLIIYLKIPCVECVWVWVWWLRPQIRHGMAYNIETEWRMVLAPSANAPTSWHSSFRTQCANNCLSFELERNVHATPLFTKLIIKIEFSSAKQFGAATRRSYCVLSAALNASTHSPNESLRTLASEEWISHFPWLAVLGSASYCFVRCVCAFEIEELFSVNH